MSRQTVLALAAGEMPNGIQADSKQGRSYAAVLAELARLRAEADQHPLTDEQVARIVELLRS